MGFQTRFERVECKFLLTKEQKEAFLADIMERLRPDAYGKSTICNLYFDTPDYRLIRTSLEKPIYKEKLRLRSYGQVKEDGTTFAEIKKKFKGVVYKRRIVMPQNAAMDFLCNGGPTPPSQIGREIAYLFDYYRELAPRVYLSYEREAYYDKNDKDLRFTFDTNVLYRREDLSLTSPVYGHPLLKEGQVLLEIKTAGAIPCWVVDALSRHKIYKSSFSKYGNAYLHFSSVHK